MRLVSRRLFLRFQSSKFMRTGPRPGGGPSFRQIPHSLQSLPPRFQSHRKSHQIILANERWFKNGPPFLGKSFTAKKSIKRHRQISQILKRAAKREANTGNDKLAAAYHRLQAKIDHCRPRRRCGSSACPKCARAFQKAKVAAQAQVIEDLAQYRTGKHLVLVTIIPKKLAFPPGQFQQINALKANRWLRDVLDRNKIHRVVIGSIDLGWEKRRGQQYLQLHWHLAMWTKNRKVLKRKLDKAFKVRKETKDPIAKVPFDVRRTDLDVIPYMNKLIKLPRLLRSAKRQLPELLLLLGRFDSMDFLFLRKVRLSIGSNGIVLKEIVNS